MIGTTSNTMGAMKSPAWLKRIAVALVLCLSEASAVSAQATAADPGLESALTPGSTVWITDTGGREDRARIVRVSGGIMTTTDGLNLRRLRTADIVRVRARHADRVVNGALIGA